MSNDRAFEIMIIKTIRNSIVSLVMKNRKLNIIIKKKLMYMMDIQLFLNDTNHYLLLYYIMYVLYAII